MDTDPGILCYQHCGTKVFCFQLPRRCAVCDNALASEDLQLPPFRLPYPFVRAAQHPCSIVIKPTIGDFLNLLRVFLAMWVAAARWRKRLFSLGCDAICTDKKLQTLAVEVSATTSVCYFINSFCNFVLCSDYLNSTDLHIGLTTSTGVVVEFDKSGLQRDRSALWLQCLSVPGATGSWTEHWDSTLEKMISSGFWVADRYDECSFNCYTFVLAFLQTLRCGELSDAADSRTTFCKQFIVPKTTAAGKYISLYRKLQNSGSYVYPCTSINNEDLGLR